MTFGWLVGPMLTSIAVALCFFWPFRFSGFSICSSCAMTQKKQDWQLPLGFVTWRTTYRPEEPTPLSKFLADSGAVGPHAHRWVFVRGSGNGIM